MRVLSAGDLLHIWDWGQGRSPTARALLMLSAAYPDVSAQTLADLPIGQRDGQLLKLRSHTFGSQLQATARCPQCAEILEYNLSVQDIVVATPDSSLLIDEDAIGEASAEPDLYRWQQEDYAVRFRLPTSADILAVFDAGDRAQKSGSTALMQRCLVAVSKQGEAIAFNSLPSEIIDALENQIAQQDPQAEILLALSCLACNHQWQILFDIVDFFWREIAVTAQRLLQQVHLLASTYGWHEADILNLSPRRRAAYINQISGGLSSGQTESPFSQVMGL